MTDEKNTSGDNQIFEDARKYINNEDPEKRPDFNIETYQKNINICLNDKESHHWVHRDVSDKIQDANLIELINRARVHIYLADYTYYPSYSDNVMTALKAAQQRGVEIHIALRNIDYKDTSASWKEMENLPNVTFSKPVDAYYSWEDTSRHMAADDAFFSTYPYEDRNQNFYEVVTSVGTHTSDVDEFAHRVFNTAPKALTQAVEMYERKMAGLQLEDALKSVNYECENQLDFDLPAYQKNLRACLYDAKPHCWPSSGKEESIAKSNIIEMIRRANDTIYIVATTDSKNFDKETAHALYKAKYYTHAKIYVALHQTSPELPDVWNEIKGYAERFCITVPASELSTHREHVVADDTYRFEVNQGTTSSPKWMGYTLTHTDEGNAPIKHFFQMRPWLYRTVSQQNKQAFFKALRTSMQDNKRQNGE